MAGVWPTDDVRPLTAECLRAYLLGLVEFEDIQRLQHRLRDEVAAGGPPTLLICEHEPCVSVGRHGSHAHMDLERWEAWRGPCPVCWVNRAGGCWLHAPGQLAIYSIIPLQRLGLTLRQYAQDLQAVFIELLGEFEFAARVRSEPGSVWIGSRPAACLGSAVRNWVTYYGAILNLHPELDWFRMLRTGREHPTMTSLQREARRSIRAPLVRERLVELFAKRFGLERTSLFMKHPNLVRKAIRHAFAAAR